MSKIHDFKIGQKLNLSDQINGCEYIYTIVETSKYHIKAVNSKGTEVYIDFAKSPYDFTGILYCKRSTV